MTSLKDVPQEIITSLQDISVSIVRCEKAVKDWKFERDGTAEIGHAETLKRYANNLLELRKMLISSDSSVEP